MEDVGRRRVKARLRAHDDDRGATGRSRSDHRGEGLDRPAHRAARARDAWRTVRTRRALVAGLVGAAHVAAHRHGDLDRPAREQGDGDEEDAEEGGSSRDPPGLPVAARGVNARP